MTLEEQSPILSSPRFNAAGTTMADADDRKPRVVHNYGISLLCVLFGLGTWLPVNAVYSQLPVFVRFAPEEWSLPSYISLLVQCANIAPLFYYLFRKKFVERQSLLISLFLTLGTISMFCLALTYRIQLPIFGALHSVYFFLFSFLLSLVGCVSSVLFLPFMNKLPELYLVPYFFGEGLSGLIPSIIALVQGVGRESCKTVVFTNGTTVTKMVPEEPYFSSTLFLSIIGCFMFLSTASFIILNYTLKFVHHPDDEHERKNQQLRNHDSVGKLSFTNFSKPLFYTLLLTQTLINCFSNGILPSIQSYSCLPYGSNSYHWSVNLQQIINPVVIYFAFFLPVVSLRVLVGCGLFEIICLSYEVLTASMSPHPPLSDTITGGIIIVFVWMVGSGLISYMKLSIAAILRQKHKSGLIKYGIVTQIGAAVGAVISFVLVNGLKVFHSVPESTYCQIH